MRSSEWRVVLVQRCFRRLRKVVTCTSRWRATSRRWRRPGTSCASVSTSSTRADFRSPCACATPASRQVPAWRSCPNRVRPATVSSALRPSCRPSARSASFFRTTCTSTRPPIYRPGSINQHSLPPPLTASTEAAGVRYFSLRFTCTVSQKSRRVLFLRRFRQKWISSDHLFRC